MLPGYHPLQVLFDKTGTLTLGRLTVAAVKLWAPEGCSEEKLLRAAGSALGCGCMCCVSSFVII